MYASVCRRGSKFNLNQSIVNAAAITLTGGRHSKLGSGADFHRHVDACKKSVFSLRSNPSFGPCRPVNHLALPCLLSCLALPAKQLNKHCLPEGVRCAVMNSSIGLIF